MELICSRPDLARWLGAVVPETHEQHRELRDRGDIVVRFTQGAPTMFWARLAEKARVKK